MREWVRMWQKRLGDKATPKELVDTIDKKKVNAATKLKDQIKRKFGLD